MLFLGLNTRKDIDKEGSIFRSISVCDQIFIFVALKISGIKMTVLTLLEIQHSHNSSIVAEVKNKMQQ